MTLAVNTDVHSEIGSGMSFGNFGDLLAHVPLGPDAKTVLGERMSEPNRHYHGIGHLEVLWRRHRIHAKEAGLIDPDLTTLIACAIAYHDSIYDAHGLENEELSSRFWLEASERSGLGSIDREWVAATIRATQDHLACNPGPYAEVDRYQQARLWVLDLDLTPLAEVPEDFERNSVNLRNEAPGFTDAEWTASAHRFLRHIDSAPKIYRSPVLEAHYEARARRNIACELAKSAHGKREPGASQAALT